MASFRTVLACAAVALAAPAASALAQTATPQGTAYAFTTPASGACPSLSFHVVLAENNTLRGVIGWDNMASMAKASGTINPADTKFQMTAKEEGGQARTFNITGQIRADNWMTLNITGASLNCTNLAVPVLWRPYQSGSGG